jgi:isoleucyl-tRNA synthetase
MAEKYDYQKIEKDTLKYWQEKDILKKIREKNKEGKKFYFLQGPPYTSGRLHMGHGWNHALKDAILRYKRQKGMNVWDRAGYDMHGLPTELKVMKNLGMNFKEEILPYGLDKFNKECRDYSVDMMKHMDEDLKKLGITLDFSDSYQPITNEFIEGQWALVKNADKNKRLYLGERTLSWCPDCGSALAKHEQEYETVTDDSIFVKMKVKDKEDEFLVIWTTTPWTIPFNLAIMVNPELEYQRCKILSGEYKGETWIVAKQLAGVFISGVANAEYKVIEEFFGDTLEGLKYTHPFSKDYKAYNEIKSEKLHSVLLSTEYVDTSAGTGLVHCAPGCGPEDYEVGYRNNLPPFNNIDEKGEFPEEMGVFKGLVAKKDDHKFIEALKERKALIAQNEVDHEYAHCWRHKTPVIFRTTKQWFFKIEDLKENILKKNKEINWVPKIASTQFDAWISNLRDNSITKQRYWGTPAPIWINEEDETDYIVISNREELKKLGCKVPEDLHKPYIDDVIIKKDGKTYKRIPDVLDVWIDAGITARNCLYNDPKLMKEWMPVDCVLEGKEQIRLWFYILAVCEELMENKEVPFKNVYCHGMLNAVDGVKMSKSLGNIISPYEITDKYGADTMRFYLASISAGQNISFSWDDIQQKYRTLNVLWNIHNYLADFITNEKIELKNVIDKKLKLEVEDEYILSVLNIAKKDVSELLERYELDKACNTINDLILTFSRDYIKMIRERSVTGDEEQKESLAQTLFKVLKDILVMSNIYIPFITEKIYQNFKGERVLNEESISHEPWVTIDEERIKPELVDEFNKAMNIITGILGARENSGLGVRWPIKSAKVISKEKIKLSKEVIEVVKEQTNTKTIDFAERFDFEYEYKLNYKALSTLFAEKTGDAAKELNNRAEEIKEKLKEGKEEIELLGETIKLKDCLDIEEKVNKPLFMSDTQIGKVIIDAERTEDLDSEGYARELVRRIQDMRKKNDFTKIEKIDLNINAEKNMLERIKKHEEYITFKVGAKQINYKDKTKKEYEETFKIKGQEFVVRFNKI